MKICKRPCQYRATKTSTPRHGCDYMLITGHSRVKAAYELLCVDRMTKEARELLEPKNCPCFQKGPRVRAPKVAANGEPAARKIRLSENTDEIRLRDWRAGLNDVQIARHVGVTPHSIQSWRTRRGLAPNSPPKRGKANG